MTLFPLRLPGIVAISLVAAGCSTLPSRQVPLSSDALSKLKRVAVVSVLARSFTQQYVGMTAFGNETEEINIASWKIDEQYEKQFSQELQQRYRLNVVHAAYAASAFEPANEILSSWSSSGNPGPNWAAAEPAVRKYCKASALDALLLVAKDKSTDFLGRTNQEMTGAGIYTRGTPFLKIAAMHVIAKVALIDCATAKPLAVRSLAVSEDGTKNARPDSRPVLQIDYEEARIPISDWTFKRKQKVRADLSTLPNKAITETLRTIFVPA
ncbi:hypothetical protein ACO0LO_18115 [Undibacterium sp. TJN25]|uniref:hypothetical protein n=1 Tax=Undibacterium sp. TJN25 TaxID=3413056 RepID=UPI003BF0961B